MPVAGEVVASEHWCSSGFANTDLDLQLKRHGIQRLIVIGLIAHTCIEATVRFAAELGYDVTVVKDAIADYSDEMMHAALTINMPNYASAICWLAGVWILYESAVDAFLDVVAHNAYFLTLIVIGVFFTLTIVHGQDFGELLWSGDALAGHVTEGVIPLIYLVAVDPGVYDAVLPVYVVGDDPATLQFTLAADQPAMMTGDTLGDPMRTALRREYTTRTVLQRLHQQQFRRRVLMAYREQCCICRLKHLELLDAAHILPDLHPQGEPSVTNGLGLCKIHHSAYDAHIIGIDPDARVHVREDILQEKDGPMLKHGLQEMAGSSLVLPRSVDLRPNRDFLAERFELFRAA